MSVPGFPPTLPYFEADGVLSCRIFLQAFESELNRTGSAVGMIGASVGHGENQQSLKKSFLN
jgi:hypothetical protein